MCCKVHGQFAVRFINQFVVRFMVSAGQFMVSVLSGSWSVCCQVHGQFAVR